jgi:acyl carrier protein
MPQVAELARARRVEIADIAARLFCATRAAVEEADCFADDDRLDADSLRMLELLARLEKHFAIRIPETHRRRMVTLQATYEVVAECAAW